MDKYSTHYFSFTGLMVVLTFTIYFKSYNNHITIPHTILYSFTIWFYRFNLGSGAVMLRPSQLVSDGAWHSVSVVR